MQNFQGSGFAVNIPEQCQDLSCYTFLLPTDKQYTPQVSIKFDRVSIDEDLNTFTSRQEMSLLENLEDYKMLNQIEGKQEGRDAIIKTIEWGNKEGRICQQLIYLLEKMGSTNRIYTITCTDLAENFSQSRSTMNEIVRSFKLSSTHHVKVA